MVTGCCQLALFRQATAGGMDMELITGQVAPLFSLEATGNQRIALEELRGKPVVLFFYPKDDTPG